MTVATVVLNSIDLIEGTITSILAQDHANLEYIVVDGGSTDGTLEIIEKYRDRIDRFVTERDRGIYDAMNKAAILAKGDYIIFMNSGDEFTNAGSVAALCDCLRHNEALVYGGWVVRYPWGLERAGTPAPRHLFWRGMFAQHQSVMVKTQYLRDHPFDLSFSLGADYAFLLRMVADGVAFRECEAQVSRVSSGGASDKNRIAVIKSHWQQARLYYPGLRTDAYYLMKITREWLAVATKRMLPARWVEAIIASKSPS